MPSSEILKKKLISRFKAAMDIIDNNPCIETYKLIIELLEKVQHESVLPHKNSQALLFFHYYEVSPCWVSSGSQQEGFEGEIFEVFDDHNFY